MADKIHFRATIQGSAACAVRHIGDGMFRKNNRSSYATIPASHIVGPDGFRAAPSDDRCAHCAGLFTDLMNKRRTRSGKPLYKDAFTKEIA